VRNKGILAFAAALLLTVSYLAAGTADTADTVIRRGIDVFTTTANGKTFYDFSKAPIPKGFFCKNSPAFSGRLALKGLPIETEIPGQLRGADTVVERLDDAAFDGTGSAVTRIRVRALSLVSIEPIKTSCGSFHAYITLDGKQRTTTMRIHRTSERGGKFLAPVSVQARMTFVPVRGSKSARRLELKGNFDFPASPIPWSTDGGPTAKKLGPLVVDTDGDLTPDTLLAGTSNFAPGWSPDLIVPKYCYLCEPEFCHEDPAKQHCTGPVYACNGAYCP
jgi:hypothetical protein